MMIDDPLLCLFELFARALEGRLGLPAAVLAGGRGHLLLQSAQSGLP